MQQLTETIELHQVTTSTKQNAKQSKEAEIRAFLILGKTLAIKHEHYVEKYVTKANEDLYALLGEILAFAEDVLANKNQDKIVKEMRNELSNSYNIKTQRNSTPLTVIVRYVTRTSRKNALIYSQVLNKAIASNITSAQLPSYIKTKGGINKIRDEAVGNLNSENAQKWNHLRAYYATKLLKERAGTSPYADFEIDKKRTSELHNIICHGDFVYMVCKKVGVGKFVAIDALAMDEELESKLLQRYFEYEEQALVGHVGAGNVDNYLLTKIQDNIDKDNEHRAQHGAPLLDKFANEIK